MSTAALCGSGGTVTGAGGATEVKHWTIDQTIDAIDATSFASLGWVERVACLKGATGSFTSIGSKSAVGAATGTFKTAAAGGYSIAGSMRISKVTITTDVNDIITFEHSFVFTGVITVS